MRTAKRKAEGNDGPGGHPGLLQLYYACLGNAEALVGDAELLFEHRRFARAFAIAYTAYEEIGKAMIAADAFQNRVSNAELSEAFSSHGVKEGYMSRSVAIPDSPKGEWPGECTIVYEKDEKGFRRRTEALYVGHGDGYVPVTRDSTIDERDANLLIGLVQSRLYEIRITTEYYGEQIGTYGLWK